MSEEENTLRESTATYVTALLDRPVGEITVRQLRQIIQEVIREEQRAAVSIDAEGYLVFPDEASYAAYLDTQPDRDPSRIRAYFINEHGFKVLYSDWVPTPEKARELEEARRQITAGEVVDGEEVFRELGL
ncbi:MAG: hypothetical protein E3J21_03875 [Anaerolineales bacterium]|nr:MAG: hypothetical protein E3J21_03875 [Anaerolineales bacterium]